MYVGPEFLYFSIFLCKNRTFSCEEYYLDGSLNLHKIWTCLYGKYGNLLYGVDFHTLKWFGSYLTNRKQKTFVNGHLSDYCTCSVQQGSILGPLSFLVYINDLSACHLYSVPRINADDTSLVLSSNNPADLQHKLNSDLAEIKTSGPFLERPGKLTDPGPVSRSSR